MKPEINSQKVASVAAHPRIAGLDYPEVLFIFGSTLLISFYYNFNPTSMGLMLFIVLPCLLLIWLSYRNIANAAQDILVVALMAVVSGAMQFCWPILMGFLLLSGVRITLARARHRLSMLITMVLTNAVFYFVSLNLVESDIVCYSSYIYGILGLSIAVSLWRFWAMSSQVEKYKSNVIKANKRLNTMVSVISKLTHFIAPQIWKPIVKNDVPVAVFNKRAKLTVMFSDIIGFTTLSDTLSADNLAEILNTYMDSMTLIANRHGALLDKFIGDGMVCFFGAPTTQGVRKDALACVAMAIDMRREMRTLRHQWRLQGFDGLYLRIGITTGYCHVGNFGSNNRLNYTLIGRVANLAARLEGSATKDSILISQDTYDYVCYDYKCVSEGMLTLKGFNSPISTFKVLDPDENNHRRSDWVDHDLPGFNLHLNFKDIKNYDYRTIKSHLNLALEQVENAEGDTISKNE